MVTATLRPRGPYSFRLSTRHGSDATRRVRDGVLTATIRNDGGLEQVQAWQRPDGAIQVRAASETGVEHVRRREPHDPHAAVILLARPAVRAARRDCDRVAPIREPVREHLHEALDPADTGAEVRAYQQHAHAIRRAGADRRAS